MAAAAAPLRRLLLRLRDPPPLPFNSLLSRLPPHLQQGPTPTPTPAPPPLPASTLPAGTPPASLRDAILSFHPGLQIHPCLDPIGDAPAAVEEGGGAAPEVWADSVKKKRKRKMNKHKLRKLRKRLRRQT